MSLNCVFLPIKQNMTMTKPADNGKWFFTLFTVKYTADMRLSENFMSNIDNNKELKMFPIFHYTQVYILILTTPG